MIRDPIDRVIIGRMLGAAAVGIFSLGVEIGFLPNSELAEPLYRALFSAFSEAGRSGLNSARAYLGVVPAALLLTMPAAVGISLVAGPLVRLALGPSWLSAVPLVWIVAIPAGLTVTGHVSGAALNAAGLPQVIFRISVISTVLKLPLVIGLVLEFGLIGGAAGFAAWTLTEQLLYLDASRRRFGVRIIQLAQHAWRSIFATGVMAAVLVECGLGWTHAPSNTMTAARELFAAAALGVAIYVVALIGAWLLSGRPDGPEIAVWNLAQSIIRRIRLRIGPARSMVGSD
jgi:O-antigen/teichoic acid export membrane protein